MTMTAGSGDSLLVANSGGTDISRVCIEPQTFHQKLCVCAFVDIGPRDRW